jgi:hypothetical protein
MPVMASLIDATAETPAMPHLGLPPAGSFDSEQTISGEMLLMRESSSRLAAKTEEMQAYTPAMLETPPAAVGEEAEMVADHEVEDVEDVDDVDDLEEVEELTNITDPRGPIRK